jgi:hypothetical protein
MPNVVTQQIGPSVYLGLIDDMVAKFPWGTDVTADYFESLLLQSALLERPLLINDGYLMHYDWGRAMLANPNSLFRQFMREGSAIILCRESDGRIDEMPIRKANLVPSYQALIDSAE